MLLNSLRKCVKGSDAGGLNDLPRKTLGWESPAEVNTRMSVGVATTE